MYLCIIVIAKIIIYYIIFSIWLPFIFKRVTLVLYKLEICTPVEYKLQIQHSIWNKILLWWINFTYVHYVLISLQTLSFMLMYYRQWKIKRKPDPWPTIPQRKQNRKNAKLYSQRAPHRTQLSVIIAYHQSHVEISFPWAA